MEIRALRKTGKKIPNPGVGGDRFIDEVVNAIPAKYNTKTTLEIDIQAGKNVADFHLQSR